MDTYMHKTMASIASLEKIEIIRSQGFMPSEARLKFLKKMIILGPKSAILGPQFCRILVLGPHFWWLGGSGPPGPPGSAPALGYDIKASSVQFSGTNCHIYQDLFPQFILYWSSGSEYRMTCRYCYFTGYLEYYTISLNEPAWVVYHAWTCE